MHQDPPSSSHANCFPRNTAEETAHLPITGPCFTERVECYQIHVFQCCTNEWKFCSSICYLVFMFFVHQGIRKPRNTSSIHTSVKNPNSFINSIYYTGEAYSFVNSPSDQLSSVCCLDKLVIIRCNLGIIISRATCDSVQSELCSSPHFTSCFLCWGCLDLNAMLCLTESESSHQVFLPFKFF